MRFQVRKALTYLVAALAIMFAAAAAYACGEAESEDPPWPPGVVIATPTVDLRNAQTSEKARESLVDANESFGAVLKAVDAGDVEALLALVQWEEQPCNTRGSYCPGLPDHAPAPVVNAGSAVTFFVTADVIRPLLKELLEGEPLKLTFASKRTDVDARYYVAFEAPGKMVFGDLPLAEPDRPIHGVFLELDARSATPIVYIDASLNAVYPSARKARDYGFDRQEIILFTEMPPPAE